MGVFIAVTQNDGHHLGQQSPFGDADVTSQKFAAK
jgi:hypothetical protein